MPIDATPGDPRIRIADTDAELERHMSELGLSCDTRQFLRKLHQAERRLNEAFETVHQGGDPEAQVSQLYHDLYRAG